MNQHLESGVRLAADFHTLLQHCSAQRALLDYRLDVVFTSNYFESPTDKFALRQVLRLLRFGERLIAFGPTSSSRRSVLSLCDDLLCRTEKSLADTMNAEETDEG